MVEVAELGTSVLLPMPGPPTMARRMVGIIREPGVTAARMTGVMALWPRAP
jgi:hypothetical protein